MNVFIAMIPAFFWGTTYAVTKYTLADWPLLLLGALRALPAGLLLLALKPCLPDKTSWRPLIIIGMVNIALFYCLIFFMAVRLPSAIAGVGMVSVPVFAMLVHWLFNRQRPSNIQLFSGAGVITLAYLLFDPQSLNLDPMGLLAMLAAILCIILGSILTKSLGRQIHWWTVLSWQLIIGGLALTLAASVQAMLTPQVYSDALEHIDSHQLLGLIWVVLLNTALAYGLYVWLLQRMSVVDFTFGGIANPAAGILCGGILLNELYRGDQYLLMVGMIVMSLLPQTLAIVTQRQHRRKTLSA